MIELETNLKLADWTYRIPESEIRRLVRERPKYYFAGGLPGNIPQNIMGTILQDIVDEIRVLDNYGNLDLLNYSSSEGHEQLRDVLSQRLHRFDNISGIDKSDLLITQGAQQSIHLTFMSLLNRGDIILIPSPCYLGIFGQLEMLDITTISIPTDKDGLIPEGIEKALEFSTQILKKKPKAIYLPSFADNPTGISHSWKRKKDLYDLLVAWNVLIIEDNAYREIKFDDKKYYPIKSLDIDNEHVLYLRTTSKEAAVLRIGYTIMPEFIQSTIIKTKGFFDLCSSLLNQEIAYRYYRDHIEATLPTLRMRYKTQADAMKKAIDDYLPGSRTDPKGGFFIWQTLDTSMDANKLLESALKSGIIFVPGDGFYPYNGLFVDDSYRMITRRIPKKNEIRLSFSSMKPEEITKGIEELSLVIESATD